MLPGIEEVNLILATCQYHSESRPLDDLQCGTLQPEGGRTDKRRGVKTLKEILIIKIFITSTINK